MMQKIVPLKKNLGRKRYNSFVDNFLKTGILQKLRTTSPTELPLEKAKELSTLIEKDRFKIEEEYHANVSDGLSMILTARFDNGYTLSAFGKFLINKSDKLEKGSAVEDFLKSNGFTGAPTGYIFERIGPNEAFRCTELLDVAKDEKGAMAIPKKEGVLGLMGQYSTIRPDEKITALLKEEKYTNYFKEKFFEAKTKNKDKTTEDAWKQKEGFEDLVERFTAMGAELDKQPKSIVHNDLHRKNLVKLVSAPSSPKIIDWDDASIGAIQKDLYRVNMSVYEHNCANAKDARDASIRKLYETIQKSQSEDGRMKYTDTLEEFTRKYLIIDALENLRFTAIAAAGTKSCKDPCLADFYTNLKDLVYTRALDTLNEMGETKLEERMEAFGKQNGLNRWDRETRTEYERTRHPDLLIGELRAKEENTEEEQNEKAFLFNQAANKRVLRRRAKKTGIGAIAAAGVLGILGYAALYFGKPIAEEWKANSFISAKSEDKEHDETSEVMIYIPEELKFIKSLHPNMDEDEIQNDPKAKELIDRFEAKQARVYETIDKILGVSHEPWHRAHLLTENILTQEEKEQIADEYISILIRLYNRSNSLVDILRKDLLAKDLKNGLFAPSTIFSFETIENILKAEINETIRSPEDFVEFFKQNSKRQDLCALLQQAYDKHNNSLVVKNEKLKALPPGTLDALLFANMLETNAIPYNLSKYAKSLGHNPDLLSEDKFFMGYLASYAAEMLKKYKDIATLFAVCTYGEHFVTNAMTCANDSTNFFEYKTFLKDRGAAAELAWFYFVRKNMDVAPEMLTLEHDTNEFLRKDQKTAIRFDAMKNSMEAIVQEMEARTRQYKEVAKAVEDSLDTTLSDMKSRLDQERETIDDYSRLMRMYFRYSQNPGFCKAHPDAAAEMREYLPTIKAIIDYHLEKMAAGESICKTYQTRKNYTREQFENEKEKLIKEHEERKKVIDEYESRIDPDKVELINKSMDRLMKTVDQYERK